MSSYEPCPGSGARGVNPNVAHTADLGSKFARMNGRTYGTCPFCGRTGLVLLRDHWLAKGSTPQYIPRHKAKEAQ